MGKHHKARKNRTQTKLSKLLSSSQTGIQARNRYFSDLSPGEISDNFKRVVNHRYFSAAAKLTKGNDLIDFYVAKSPSTSIENSTAWCLGLVEYFKEELQTALDKEQVLSGLILSKDYENAITIINEIDALCGLSIWSLSIRGAIENRAEMEIEESDKISNILKEATSNTFLNFITKYSSDYFNEESIFFTSTKTTEMDIKRSAHSSVKDFFLYRILTPKANNDYNFEDIFNIEKNSSIIDVFFLLLSFAHYCQSPFGKFYQDQALASKVIKALQTKLRYPTIDRMANMIGIATNWNYAKIDSEIIDLYTKGKYSDVCHLANKKGIYAFDFSIFELIAKSNIRSNNLDLSQDSFEMVSKFQNIILRNEQYNQSLERISCLAHSFRYLRWFRQMSLFAQKESRFVNRQNRDFYEAAILINADVNSPGFSKALPPDIAKHYLDTISTNNEDSASIDLFRRLHLTPDAFDIENIDVERLRAKKYKAQNLINNEEFDKATELYGELIASNDLIISIESTRLLAESLLNSGKTEEAINCFVEASLENRKLLTIFDTDSFLRKAKEIVKGNKNINVPIAYSFHSRFSNSKYDPNLRYSFETFLISNNAKIPQDLFGREAELGTRKLHYFLKWVCIPELMKLYFEFDNLRQIEECRLDVCSYLMEHGATSDRLQNEVKEINRTHVIRRAAKRVESSRIYVDTSNLLDRNSQQYRPLFDRYTELCTGDYSQEEDEKSFEKIEGIFRGADDEKNYLIYKQLSLLHVPHLRINAKNATFLSLAKLVRTEFTYGERGLNNHLSTRIRHGVLPTTFRKPIVDEQLFIPHALKLDRFLNDSKWSCGETPFQARDIEKVWKLLQRFSQDYEILISEINDEWLQIHTMEEVSSGLLQDKKTSKGLFNYSTSPLECYALQKELPLSPSYEEFIKVSTNWLWDRTEYILIEVQKSFRENGKEKAFHLLEDLKKNIQKSLGSNPEVSEFCNSVDRAKSALSIQIEAICSWFTHVDMDEEEEFDLETAIDIAMRSLNVEVAITKKIDCIFSESILTYVVDMFFILFENAISKSNTPKESLCLRVVLDSDKDNDIKIMTTNCCAMEKEINSLNSDLDYYRDAYGDEVLIKDTLQEEGGTGFFKIWKILEKDLEISHKANFMFLDNGTFEVTLILKKSKSLKIL